MELHGRNIVGDSLGEPGASAFRAVEAATGKTLEPPFYEASPADVDAGVNSAYTAFDEYRRCSPAERAQFLRDIATHIEALGDELIERANAETSLDVERLRGERTRTTGQLRLFAGLIEEGSWVGARIDRAIPDRKPLPRPDIRRMQIPIGPVVVFAASNFPLAFSVAGGDTAAALAAGCSVVVKAHPAHPGTSEMIGSAILRAAALTKMPVGIFSLLHGRSPELSLSLVRHPQAAAIAFTGSLQAGRALFDAAAARPSPIPVYAEMGSVNPVFLLPNALAERGELIAQGLTQSVTLGVGQFCTKPGVIVALHDDATDRFLDAAQQFVKLAPPGSMLHAGIRRAYIQGTKQTSALPGVVTTSSAQCPSEMQILPTLFLASGDTFLANAKLGEELFGPAAVVVTASSREQMQEIARKLQGHLTATIQGTTEDLRDFTELVQILQLKVGRLIFNGFPTGVEVCPSMHHGGPYPATTDSRTTSVGTAAIERFVRPVSYQNFPQEALPLELRDDNSRHIWRLVDSQWTNATK